MKIRKLEKTCNDLKQNLRNIFPKYERTTDIIIVTALLGTAYYFYQKYQAQPQTSQNCCDIMNNPYIMTIEYAKCFLLSKLVRREAKKYRQLRNAKFFGPKNL